MLEHENILETLNMIREECLDIRTITMGVSLWDCRATAPGLLADQVYDKITEITEPLMKFRGDPWWFFEGRFPTDMAKRFILK